MKNKNNLYIKNKTLSPIVRKSQKGFTLLETLVAIFILTLSMTGPVYIASVGFRNTIDSRDNVSAQYIAEEVIEVIKNKRDSLSMKESLGATDLWFKNIIGNNDDCINESGSSVNKCYMESVPSFIGDYTFKACFDTGCPNISFNPGGSFNVYGEEWQNTSSKFVREFYIEKEIIDVGSYVSSVKLTVNIKWNDKGRDKVYSLTQRLYNVRYLETFNSN